MKKLYWASCAYLALGLIAGVFYREFTKVFDGHGGETQLNTLHTHLLALGMMFFLICIALERAFTLSAHRRFSTWFILHNVALVWTIGFMVANGVVHAMNKDELWGPAWSGLAGVGHILLTVSFVMFFVILNKRIRVTEYQHSQAIASQATKQKG